MSASLARSVAVVIERRACDNPWLDWQWSASAIVLDPEMQGDWRLLYESEGLRRFLSPTLNLELHRAETTGYLENLNSPAPAVFVVLRENEEGGRTVPFDVHLVTFNPFEAQDYLDSSEETVERVVTSEEAVAWLAEFCRRHHKGEVFKKRRRDRHDVEAHDFGQEPVVELRRRGLVNGSEAGR